MKNLLIIALITFSITACTPDDPVITGTSSPFTLKYEIITSSSISTTPPFAGSMSIGYTNATGQVEQDISLSSLISGTSWTKEIVVTTSRPFPAVMNALLFLNSPRTVIGNIYVNGIRVAQVEKSSLGTANSVNFQMMYSVY